MTRPDYVSEELWERAARCTGFGGGHEMQGVINQQRIEICRALLQARNDALREAAETADKVYLSYAANDPEGFGAKEARNAILSIIQEPS